jgi:phosphocarrier protein FPr/phosphocarrier protein
MILTAPLSGWAGPLDEVPDPVFAERMLGDGVAIDPTGGELRAPCAGRILTLHAAGHALSLRATKGPEILIHIGLETVALAGEGFAAHVRVGQEVGAGELLITFDVDLVARRAASLITPIVITNGAAFAIVRRAQDRQVEAGDFLMEIHPVAGAATVEAPREAARASAEATVPLAHGLHARPAARIAARAREFDAQVRLVSAGGEASATSAIAIMALGAGEGEKLGVTATGPDAAAAVAAIAQLIEHGLAAHEAAAPAPAAAPPLAPPRPAPESRRPGGFVGIGAAPGLAIGAAHHLIAPEILVADAAGPPAGETAALAAALAAVRVRLAATAGQGPPAQREILAAHLEFLGDEALAAGAASAIAAGASAGAAWRGAVRDQAEKLIALSDPVLAERAADLIDLERQVLIELGGEPASPDDPPESAIILARDLVPSEVMALPASIGGLCTAQGGPTSHVAILAAARGIPAVVAAGEEVMGIADGATLILDGDAGFLSVGPGAMELEAAQSRLAVRHQRRTAALAAAALEGRMADGTRIEVFANLGSVEDAAAAVSAGAEGCGLLRTEFLFLGRADAPSEDEQAAQYQAIAEALGGRPLIIRTLDVGGDKPVPYLAIAAEENPALGLRGVRVSLRHPDVLAAQLRAILRIRPAGQARIMIPMVSGLAELDAVRAMVDQARAQTGHDAPVPVGVMVETPAAAVTADLLARDADFLSVGSNDLTQYVLAMDRGNPALAADVDALHPAVLRLIGQAVAGARAFGRPVGVCGALAGDLAAVPILIGLGATELSAPPAAVAEIKALVRTLGLAPCEDLARRAQACATAREVRALALGGEP